MGIVSQMHNDKRLTFGNMTIEFITACHATPLYSHLHLGNATNFVPLRFLDCSPHFDDENDGKLTREKTASWYLHVEPDEYLKNVLAKAYASTACPKYFIISSIHLLSAQIVIKQCKYEEKARFLDNYFDDSHLIAFSSFY